jgi:hypothetical protein
VREMLLQVIGYGGPAALDRRHQHHRLQTEPAAVPLREP